MQGLARVVVLLSLVHLFLFFLLKTSAGFPRDFSLEVFLIRYDVTHYLVSRFFGSMIAPQDVLAYRTNLFLKNQTIELFSFRTLMKRGPDMIVFLSNFGMPTRQLKYTYKKALKRVEARTSFVL